MFLRCRAQPKCSAVAYAVTMYPQVAGPDARESGSQPDRKDFTPGLTYVALSRVKSLSGLLFEESFDLKRLRTPTSETIIMRKSDYTRRAAQELPLPDEEDLPSGPLMPPPSTIPSILSHPIRSSAAIPTSEFNAEHLSSAFDEAMDIQGQQGGEGNNEGQGGHGHGSSEGDDDVSMEGT
ncbi:hypothetical protein EJ04DRAFT_598965 [Polyplosphaeria fusca]|uniref:Uncharacterized protein n=1 Tax=Polyplosphaeria fusca TaxID=682080 RepID=A0A9P4R3R9_9PLEO|nr:hypothetical protein EJ04DRAFT_598965 [Polyplosphaeria fusca]